MVATKMIPETEVTTVFQGTNHIVDQPVKRASAINDEVKIMKIAPIPAYMVWDGSNQDLNAAMVHERVRESQGCR